MEKALKIYTEVMRLVKRLKKIPLGRSKKHKERVIIISSKDSDDSSTGLILKVINGCYFVFYGLAWAQHLHLVEEKRKLLMGEQ
ncbi:poly(rC)-binding protein 4-like [Pyrus ussuriensis x Pyrus communis]|uniref:Poly(RC)-binding protein 4-like n=1 Tax=Pyrus ussuriensis x Pyrus communis TaxID=2448454 RepID=A0A5N5HC58_9ROSA|nr:poly(rC)-binding protein 4-like [Pyrus ussuriensis x Pyrus communis]